MRLLIFKSNKRGRSLLVHRVRRLAGSALACRWDRGKAEGKSAPRRSLAVTGKERLALLPSDNGGEEIDLSRELAGEGDEEDMYWQGMDLME